MAMKIESLWSYTDISAISGWRAESSSPAWLLIRIIFLSWRILCKSWKVLLICISERRRIWWNHVFSLLPANRGKVSFISIYFDWIYGHINWDAAVYFSGHFPLANNLRHLVAKLAPDFAVLYKFHHKICFTNSENFQLYSPNSARVTSPRI